MPMELLLSIGCKIPTHHRAMMHLPMPYRLPIAMLKPLLVYLVLPALFPEATEELPLHVGRDRGNWKGLENPWYPPACPSYGIAKGLGALYAHYGLSWLQIVPTLAKEISWRSHVAQKKLCLFPYV